MTDPRDPTEQLLTAYTEFLLQHGVITQKDDAWDVALLVRGFLLRQAKL